MTDTKPSETERQSKEQLKANLGQNRLDWTLIFLPSLKGQDRGRMRIGLRR